MAYSAWSVVNFEQPDVNKWNILGENDAFFLASLGGGLTTFSGMTLAREYTLPDADATLARIDAGQTFTGVNIFTSPKIITSIDDTNGNELLKVTATASAVNEVTIANAGTGGSPTLSATGGDTDIGINFFSKGNGFFGWNTATPNGKYTFIQGDLAYDNGAGLRIQSSAGADRNFLFFFTDETNGYSGIQSYRDGSGTGAKALHLNKLGGDIYIGGNTYQAGAFSEIGVNVSVSDVKLSLAQGRSGNGNTYINFISDATYTTYGTRLIRNGGVNASFDILHRGTGGISIVCQDGGGISIPTPINFAIDAQANDTYVITLSPVIYAYYTGQRIIFKANTINTGAATINVNGLGAKTIVKRLNTTLANGDILAGMICDLIYDGTNFVLLNPVVN